MNSYILRFTFKWRITTTAMLLVVWVITSMHIRAINQDNSLPHTQYDEIEHLANTLVRMPLEQAAKKLFALPVEVQQRLLRAINPRRAQRIQEILATMTEDDVCSICHESLQEGELIPQEVIACHAFHKGCITQWLQRSATCPLCRNAIKIPVEEPVVQEVGGGRITHPTCPFYEADRAHAQREADIRDAVVVEHAPVVPLSPLVTTLFERIRTLDDAQLREMIKSHRLNRELSLPLHVAVLMGNLPLIERLIALGDDINAQDSDGNTPLLLALNQRNGDLAHQLMLRGARVDIANHAGETALDLATRFGI